MAGSGECFMPRHTLLYIRHKKAILYVKSRRISLSSYRSVENKIQYIQLFNYFSAEGGLWRGNFSFSLTIG
jgi:hypothetical protein